MTLPELPEVETVVRGLQPMLVGRRVTSARLRYASLYHRGSLSVRRVVGRTIGAVERVGKNVVIRFEPEAVMLINLGMTGRLAVHPARARRREPHLHGVIGLGRDELRYYDVRRFGHFYVSEAPDLRTPLGIGPDPFEADADYLAEALAGRSAPIKSLLLHQEIVSGIGNIYADETLFDARLHPLTTGERASKRADSILASARAILTRAIEHGGSTVRDYRRHDGSAGEFQHHHAVYGRDGAGCLRCGGRVRKLVLSGRSSHYCPRCQRLRRS